MVEILMIALMSSTQENAIADIPELIIEEIRLTDSLLSKKELELKTFDEMILLLKNYSYRTGLLRYWRKNG